MKRPLSSRVAQRLTALVLVALVMVSTVSITAQSAGAQSEPNDGKVLIITAPRLTWSVVDEVRPPNLMSLLDRSAVASTTVRTAGSVTRPADAYLTIGAGNRMAASPLFLAGQVLERTETLTEQDPTEEYERNTGIEATKPMVSLNKPRIDRFNKQTYFFGAEAGSLATALNDDGRSIAVLGNADRSMLNSYERHVGLAAMGTDGQIDGGMVGPELLRFNAEFPYGIEIDADVHDRVFDRAWGINDVVIAELSDLERAEASRITSTEEQADQQYEDALMASDALVGQMLSHVDWSTDTVILVAPTAPLEQLELTVFAIAGEGIERGWAESSTTRRARFVSLTDIAPTVLAKFDVPTPDSMGDTRISASADDVEIGEQMDRLAADSSRAVLRDRTFGPISVVFVVALVLTIALAMLCLARVPRLNPVIRWMTLFELSFLSTTYLLGMFHFTEITPLVVGLIGGTVGFAVLASFLRRIDRAMPAFALVGLLWLVLAVDIATGGHLQLNTTFGYSPIVAGRFAGFGNQAYSMIAISCVLLAAGFADRRAVDAKGRATTATVAIIAVWTFITLVLDGHPAMGSDVGGVLAIVPSAGVLLLLLRKIKISPKLIVLMAVATVAVLALFAGLDLSRPPESRTHLGRFVEDLFNGQAGQIIQRKVNANIRVLTSVWSWVIPAALVYFCYLTWRPNQTFRKLIERYPNYRAFGISALTLGFLSMALNDSGVSLPAIMVAIASAYTINLVMDMERSDV